MVAVTSSKSGFEKLVDYNVSTIAEFAKLNEPILDELITFEEIRKASTKLQKLKLARQPEMIVYLTSNNNS